MTGPEHYREAEKAIEASAWQRQNWGELMDGSDESAAALDAAAWEMRRAQVHATLAAAAATAEAFTPFDRNDQTWQQVLR